MQRSEIPLSARVELAHAELQAVARATGADVLLVKGYALDPRLQHAGRHSTDVDLLVRPAHVDRVVEALRAHGWQTVSTFRSGSIFHHAQTMRHERWGLVDVHRAFPGFELAPDELFEALWRHRTPRLVAAYPCEVPQLLDQALLLAVHAARSPRNIERDVGHLVRVLAPEDWRMLENRADELGASVAFAAATGRLALYRDRPTHDLWLVLSRDGTRSQEWRARMRAATTLRAKLRLVARAPLPNVDHLAMDLDRRPSPAEVLRAAAARPLTAVRDLLTGRARLPGAQDGPADAGPNAVAVTPPAEEPDAGGGGTTTPAVGAESTAPPAFPATGDVTAQPSHTAPGAEPAASVFTASAREDAERTGPGGPSRGGHLPAEDVAVVEVRSAPENPPDPSLTPVVYLARVPGGAPLVLNDSAALVWRAALEVPLNGVVPAVAHAAGVDPADIHEDALDFVSHLVGEGFLVPVEDRHDPGTAGSHC